MGRNFLEKKSIKNKTNRDTAREYDRSRTSVVLMEIIISLFLFMVVGSVCIQLFVQSFRMNMESEILERSSMLSSSVADQLLVHHGNLEEVSQYYKEYAMTSNILCLYYDDDFNLTSYTNYEYYMEITASNQNSKLRDINIIMYDHDNINIYEMNLEVATYGN